MNLIDHNDSTKKYLIGRDIRLETIEKLSIRWVSKARATSSVFGKDAVSPDGLIIFPLTTTEAKFFGKNFYLCVESEQEHLTLFNESRKRRGEEPESKVPKYLNSKGDRNKDHLVYDPYALLNQDLAELPEPLFATEDTIGVVKAAQDGHRILSSFGVWLVTNKHLEELKNDPDWEHPLKGKFPLYLADSDCFEKVGVFHALVRTGYVLGCRIGAFGSDNPKQKIGLDEFLDNKGDLTRFKGRHVRDFVLIGLKKVISTHEELYPDQKERQDKLYAFYNQIEKEIKLHDPEFLCDSEMKNLKALFKKIDESKKSITEDQGDPSKTLLLIADKVICFHTPEQEGYADIIIDGNLYTYKIQSKAFKNWLINEYYKKIKNSVSTYCLNDLLSTLEARAIHEGRQREVALRVAEYQGKIYLDLGTTDRQIIEIDSDGWGIVSDYPIRFRRPDTFLDLPVPIEGGSLNELKEILNIDERSWILTIAFLMFCFYPRHPHPVLILHGEQGSGKSTIAEFLKSLIDPGKAPLMGQVNDARELAVSALNRWVVAYDNLSGLRANKSDAICRMSTGDGFSTRTLHTNSEETVFEFMRPQIITGIDSLATRGDLLERSLLVNLPSIPEEERCTREELEDKLTQARPRILGALLTALSQTLKALPDTRPNRLPRMADFAKFAIASEAALGLEPGAFLNAFDSNRDEAHEIALESSPVAQALIDFTQSNSTWSGTASKLLNTLNAMGHESTQSRSWPKSPASLGKAITRIAPNLRSVGIAVNSQRSSKERSITIERTNAEQSQQSEHVVNVPLDPEFSIKPEQKSKNKHVTGYRTRLK